ncbi:dynein heavy chain, cytoplasmic [Diutina catenulata]
MGLTGYLRQIAESQVPDAVVEIPELDAFIESPHHASLFLLRCNAKEFRVILDAGDIDQWLQDGSTKDLTMVIKPRGEYVDTTTLRVVSMPISAGDIDPLYSIVKAGLAPVFQVVGRNSAMLAPTKKKFHDLQLSLQHLGLNFEVPDLAATAHPKILAGVDANEDPEFLNELTSVVNQWIIDIQGITYLEHAPSDGTSLMDEIHFWRAMDHALSSISTQINQPFVVDSLNILNNAKRFHITTAFKNDIGIAAQSERCKAINGVLREIPVESMMAIDVKNGELSSLLRLQASIIAAFATLRSKIGTSSVDVSRLQTWLELLVVDVVTKMSSAVSAMSLMALPYEDFIATVRTIDEQVVAEVDRSIKYSINVLREVVRKRSEKYVPLRVETNTWEHLKRCLSAMQSFRSNHHRLVAVVEAIEGDSGKLLEAYRRFAVSADPLGPSWPIAENQYAQCARQVQSMVAAHLEEWFSLCEDFADFVHVVSTSGVESMVSDTTRLQMLQVAANEIDEVGQEHYDRYFWDSNAILTGDAVLTTIKDARARLASIAYYKSGLELVLGPHWSKYSTGALIERRIGEIERDLDPESIISKWANHASSKMSKGKGGLFKQTEHASGADVVVNFDLSTVQYGLVMSQLVALGHKVPTHLKMSIESLSSSVYLVARGLHQHLHLLKSDLMTTHAYSWVLFEQFSEVINNFRVLVDGVTWETLMSHLDSVNLWFSTVSDAHANVTQLGRTSYHVRSELERLRQCNYTRSDIFSVINRIGSLDVYRAQPSVDLDIAKVLLAKCSYQLNHILSCLADSSLDHSKSKKHASIMEGTDNSYWGPLLEPPRIKHDLIFSDQRFYVSPSLAEAKLKLTRYVSDIIEICCPVDTGVSELFEDHSAALSDVVSSVLERVDELVKIGLEWVSRWKALQNLWELHPYDSVDLARLFNGNRGLSMSSWIDLMRNISEERHLFDNADTKVNLGRVIEISYSKVQSRVNIKFDRFYTELLDQFSIFTTEFTSQKIRELEETKVSLQPKLTIDDEPSRVVFNLHQFISTSKRFPDWEAALAETKAAQQIIEMARYRPKVNWVHFERLESVLLDVSILLRSKTAFIDGNHEKLRSVCESESARVQHQLTALNSDWALKKPHHQQPDVAIKSLETFETLANNLLLAHTHLVSVCSMLAVPVPSGSIKQILNEIDSHKEVWIAINHIWQELSDLKIKRWTEVKPRKVRQQLDALVKDLQEIAEPIKQYAAYEDLATSLAALLKTIPTIQDLKSDAMTSKYWQLLGGQVGHQNLDSSTMTLGTVWSLNLVANDLTVREVLLQANQEQVVLENLQAIEIEWQSIAFELFSFENKCRLIKNWSALFARCEGDMSTLSSMRSHTEHSSLGSKIAGFESRLSKIKRTLDKWIELQESWVYLDGVFNRGEINNLMSVETARYNHVTFEFFALMKRLFKINLVWDIVTIPDLETTLTRLVEQLDKIRRSLTDFLERQRALFPRFYFVGNSDLLEMIGSTSVAAVNRHIAKMFVGIRGLVYDSERSSVVGVLGDLSEVVHLSTSISLTRFPKLYEWLGELENSIKETLAELVESAIGDLEMQDTVVSPTSNSPLAFLEKYPAQISVLAAQVVFCRKVELNCLTVDVVSSTLSRLSTLVTSDSTPLMQRKLEHHIIEHLHFRDILSSLETRGMQFWQRQQRFYYDHSQPSIERVSVAQLTTRYIYGFEYLGVPEKLAYTPLTDSCFLTMTQAMSQKLGGCPFGPAGTGKTETIKSLAHNLGKMVLVWCCDDTFDFQSMGRIFAGVCQVGVWGCFDEFNRLEEGMLSAVATQVEAIQCGLSQPSQTVELANNSISVHANTAIFVTLNPSYAGRSELPENLRKMFRMFAMTRPDLLTIVEVLMYSRAFTSAKEVANLIVPFFMELPLTLSLQSHYDFGLRAIKSVVVRCGQLKLAGATMSESDIAVLSIQEVILPRLTKEDEVKFRKLISKHFSRQAPEQILTHDFRMRLKNYMDSNGFVTSSDWTVKAYQLLSTLEAHKGVILIGDSGTGKSAVWRSVLASMGGESKSYVIDAKVLTKSQLFGRLDHITREWTDGLLTGLIRKIHANLRGERVVRTWVVFDGDIDPEWAETLNSVLDDNKVLTLANGERLAVPDNLSILFEASDLRYTTPATVSRCGMVWFDASVVSLDLRWKKLIHDVEKLFPEFAKHLAAISTKEIVNISKLVVGLPHVMPYTPSRGFSSVSAFIMNHAQRLKDYCETANIATIADIRSYVINSVALGLAWGYAGELLSEHQRKVVEAVSEVFEIDERVDLLTSEITLPDVEWRAFTPPVAPDLEPHQVHSQTVVDTIDTVRNHHLVHSMLRHHRALIMCGPPGSGKTMTLLAALRSLPNLTIVSLNFSKHTTAEQVLLSLLQYCHYQQEVTGGMELTPKIPGSWVVVFCDEINLPQPDRYGTQGVVSLLRQIMEQRGFWGGPHVGKPEWVSLCRVQFVGACNYPTDPGRHQLSPRFLAQASVFVVDYPAEKSLVHIYTAFNRAVLKCCSEVRGSADNLTAAMVDVYTRTKTKLVPTPEHPHYVYSPRELTRWSRGILTVVSQSYVSSVAQLMRIWYHEGLRLFADRLSTIGEQRWQREVIKHALASNFPSIDIDEVVSEPLYFSHWLSSQYEAADPEVLREFLSERLRVFSEEEVEVDLILHQDVLDHALRIDRVLCQRQGHMILVGAPASGKTTLTRFVAWINGLKVIQLTVDRHFDLNRFDAILRSLLLRCAAGEQLCFIIDESSILETSFIERMNTLLANSEVPGLFEGEQYTQLMQVCLAQSQAQGFLLESNEELYGWFSQQISNNLHVIFVISNITASRGKLVISSPALFNRCVLSWMGNWQISSLVDVARNLLASCPLDMPYTLPKSLTTTTHVDIRTFRDVLVDAFVFTHELANQKRSFTSPNTFLRLVKLFISSFEYKMSELENDHRHKLAGLDQLRDTMLRMGEMQLQLQNSREELLRKDSEAKKMLNRMLSEQNDAERKREFSVATQAELEKQEIEIKQRQSRVLSDLERVAPAVAAAQAGVQNIKKQHLTELRSMVNPPQAVKLTMESVCTLLGYQATNWRSVQSIIRKDDFIASIVSFDSEQLSVELHDFMEKTYMARGDFTSDQAHRASQACGPLFEWVLAQLTYSRILHDIAPLREEVARLEEQRKKTQLQVVAINQMISELEISIDASKKRYSEVIGDAGSIKHQMARVQEKVDRSNMLIESLTTERERWKEAINQFSTQRQKLVGDSVLSAAFSVYAAAWDEREREHWMRAIQDKLRGSTISFDTLRSRSTSQWHPTGFSKLEELDLNGDPLILDNLATIMNSTDPVVVLDPEGTFKDVIPLVYPKAIHTSFLSAGFVTHLENALRFGGVLIVADGEIYDPIINSVVRGDLYRTGGRPMVRIGENVVDFSEGFRLIIHTSDGELQIPSFVTSRSVVVNFSITAGSLESKVLDMVLAHINPDVHHQRGDLAEMRGKLTWQLSRLENELLQGISEAPGSLLDNSSLIDTLKRLKVEAGVVDQKLSSMRAMVETVDIVRNKFVDIARHATIIHSFLLRTGGLSRFYPLSLSQLLQIVSTVLSSTRENAMEIDVFVTDLYREVYAQIWPRLTNRDKVVVAIGLLLCLDESLSSDVINLCGVVGKSESANAKTVTSSKLHRIVDMVSSSSNPATTLIDELSKLTEFLSSGLGSFSSHYDWKRAIVTDRGPFVLVSPPGVDPTLQISGLAHQYGESLRIISMGATEGIEEADHALKSADYGWLLFSNVQTSPQWLSKLHKALSEVESVVPKVFLTCNITSQIPSDVISLSRVVLFESPPGLQNMVRETLKFLPTNVEHPHLHFLLVWFHSVLVERLRYVPVSFKRVYEFSDKDFALAVIAINELTSQTEEIAWEQIAHTIGSVIYGSQVDFAEDMDFIRGLASHLFSVSSLDNDFNLIWSVNEVGETLHLPKTNDYASWIDNALPGSTPLTWIGLSEQVNFTWCNEFNKAIAEAVCELFAY